MSTKNSPLYFVVAEVVDERKMGSLAHGAREMEPEVREGRIAVNEQGTHEERRRDADYMMGAARALLGIFADHRDTFPSDRAMARNWVLAYERLQNRQRACLPWCPQTFPAPGRRTFPCPDCGADDVSVPHEPCQTLYPAPAPAVCPGCDGDRIEDGKCLDCDGYGTCLHCDGGSYRAPLCRH